MTTRWDNLDLDAMVDLHADMRRDAKALHDAIIERFKAICPVKIGKVYRIKPLPEGVRPWYGERLGGRWIYVMGLVAGFDSLGTRFSFRVSGPLKRPSISPIRNGHFGGRYTSDCEQVSANRIDLTTEQDPPA